MLITKRIKKEQYENMSLELLEYVLRLQGNSSYSVSGKIRQLNRAWNKSLTGHSCQSCSYNKSVELAHLKAIKLFSKDSLLKEINHPDNILVLCARCHTEYDCGLLLLEDIPVRKNK